MLLIKLSASTSGKVIACLLILIIIYFWLFKKLPLYKLKNKKKSNTKSVKNESENFEKINIKFNPNKVEDAIKARLNLSKVVANKEKTIVNTQEPLTEGDTSTNHRWFDNSGIIKPEYSSKFKEINFSEEQINQGFVYLFLIYENLKGVDFTKIYIERQNNYPNKKDLLKNSSYWKFSFLGSAVLYNSFNKSDFKSELKKLLDKNSIDESSKVTKKDYEYWEGDGFIIEHPKSKGSNIILISNNNVINSERIVVSMRDEKSIKETYINNKYSINPNHVFFIEENMEISKIFGVHLEDLKNIAGPTRTNSEIAIDLIEDKILPFTDEQINNGIANIETLFFRNLKGIRFDKIQLPSILNQDFFTNPNDINGNWYFTVTNFAMIIKAFSANTINQELDKILEINNIDKKNKYSDSQRDYWVGEGFSIEIPKIPNTNMIIISNENICAAGADDIRETEITNKTHNVNWIKGLKIYDGQEVLNFDNTMHKAQNVPLLFLDQDVDYILIPCYSTFTIAKSIIDKIIDLNGGKNNFNNLKELEPEKTKNWEYIWGGFQFNIGFLGEYKMIRINKISVESVKELDKRLDSISSGWHQIIINRANWNDSVRKIEGMKEANSFWSLALGHKDEYMLKYNEGVKEGEEVFGIEAIEYRINIYHSFIFEFEKLFYYYQGSNKKIPKIVYSKFLALVESLAGAELTKILMKEEGEEAEIESIYKRIKRPNDDTIENPDEIDFVDKDEFTHYKGYLFNGICVEKLAFDGNENGNVYTPFRFGLKHGVEECRYENGQLKGKYRYFNDQLIETIEEYNEDGTKKKYEN